MLRIACFTSAPVRAGFFDNKRAAVPATSGAENEVPSTLKYSGLLVLFDATSVIFIVSISQNRVKEAPYDHTSQ